MARNVTDAAVLLGAATGVDPDDAATAAQAGHAFTDYTQFLDDEALEGARIGVWRAGTYDPALVGPVVEPILDDAIDALEAEGATVIDGTDIDLSATANEFPALLCEFKTDIATYLETYVDGTNPVTGQPYPQTLAELIEFNQAHPRARGPLERCASSSSPRRRTAGTRDCAAIRAGDDAARSGRDRRAHGRERPRCDHRADQRPGLADERRTPTRATSTATSSTSWARRRRLRCRATPTSRCPPATTRDCRSGSPSSAAAGPNRSCSALPTTTSRRRRFVSRRSSSRRLATICSPASQTRRRAGAAAAGDPGSARSRRALPVEACRGDNEARPLGRASCCVLDVAARPRTPRH